MVQKNSQTTTRDIKVRLEMPQTPAKSLSNVCDGERARSLRIWPTLSNSAQLACEGERDVQGGVAALWGFSGLTHNFKCSTKMTCEGGRDVPRGMWQSCERRFRLDAQLHIVRSWHTRGRGMHWGYLGSTKMACEGGRDVLGGAVAVLWGGSGLTHNFKCSTQLTYEGERDVLGLFSSAVKRFGTRPIWLHICAGL